MGAFVLGVLVGWLAEWLFFTFWVKGGSNDNSSDCDSLRSELSAKNNELIALKAELSSASTSNASSTTNSKTTAATTAVTNNSVSSAKSKEKKVATAKSTVTKKPVAKKAADTKKSTKAKKAVTAKKAEHPKKTTVATKTKKAEAPKKSTSTKKPAPKKATQKTTTAAKKVVKKAPTKRAIKNTSGDDFTKLSGIGPSMSNNLKELGITSYEKLAAMDDDILKDMLEASGAKLNNNKDAMSSWNEQATMAAKGDFAGLKELQEALKK